MSRQLRLGNREIVSSYYYSPKAIVCVGVRSQSIHLHKAAQYYSTSGWG